MRRHLHGVSTQLSLAFVVALVAAPAALATDLRSPDARDAARNPAVSTSSVPGAIDLRSPDRVVAPATAQQPHPFVVERISPEGRGPQGVPTANVVSVRGQDGFDWGDAGIGAGSTAAAILLALGAGALIVQRRHRTTGKSVLSS
jgi:hypothetical protein